MDECAEALAWATQRVIETHVLQSNTLLFKVKGGLNLQLRGPGFTVKGGLNLQLRGPGFTAKGALNLQITANRPRDNRESARDNRELGAR